MKSIIPGRLKLRLNNSNWSNLRSLNADNGIGKCINRIELSRAILRFRHLFLLCLVLIALGAVSSCSLLSGDKNSKLDQVLTPLPDDNSASPEALIGANEHPKIVVANGGAYVDPKLNKMLAEIVASLTAHSKDGIKKYTSRY